MRKALTVLVLSAAMLALAACGGSEDPFEGSGSSSGSASSESSSSAAVASVANLSLETSAPSIANDGSQTATITALATNSSNVLIEGVPVNFSASSGGIAVTQATTGSTGSATATLSPAGDPTLRTITVTATAGSKTATIQVAVIAATSGTSYQMGNGSGNTFVAGVISIGSPNLSAGASTGLQVSVVTQNGTLYTGSPVTVTFNSPCVAAGTASITQNGGGGTPGQVTTSSGLASATYTSEGCSGADDLTATAAVGGQNLSASGTITVAAASVGSIQFVSATPISIGLKGTGLNETSTVIFKVLDSTGGPVAGATVNFSLDTSVGGIALAPTSGTTAADGTVQTVVSSGTAHTTVRVTASISSPALSTQSSQLTVTTGLPASNAFSIAVGAAKYGAKGVSTPPACPNVEAYDVDLVQVPFTVQLADRYNNPAPDGTAVAFTTNGGHIVGSCSTPLATPGDGTCQVTWTSANPRPTTSSTPPVKEDGRATVLATAIGEESFDDLDGSGYYVSGDPFSNLGEPYRDDGELGSYLLGDYFLDFLHTGTYYPADGTFKGITCTGSGAGASCATTTWAIGVQHLIIMSTSAAQVSVFGVSGFGYSGGAITGSHSPATAGTVVFQVEDLNTNPISAGSTITITSGNTSVLTVSSTTSSFVEGCNTAIGGDYWPVSLSVTAVAAGSTTLTVTVTSAGTGSISQYSFPVTIS